MSTPRYPWFWWGCGWLLVAAVCLGSLVPSRQLPAIITLVDDKIIHALTYAVLTLWFSGLYRRNRNLVAIVILLFVLGLLLDMLQGMVSRRSFDLWDVAANAGGILLAWGIARAGLAGWCERIERLITV